MNLAAFPAVNFVVNVSPPRDLWYGEELKKRKKRGSAEPEAKAAPLLEVGLPDLLGPPMQSPVSPSSSMPIVSGILFQAFFFVLCMFVF